MDYIGDYREQDKNTICRRTFRQLLREKIYIEKYGNNSQLSTIIRLIKLFDKIENTHRNSVEEIKEYILEVEKIPNNPDYVIENINDIKKIL
jgi:hypothetical protein